MKTTIRILLTLVLIYAVYRETGAFTALALLLLFAHTEAQVFINRMFADELKINMGFTKKRLERK